MIPIKKSCGKKNKIFPFSIVSSNRLPRPSISPLQFREVNTSNFVRKHNFNIHDVAESVLEEQVSQTLDIELKF